MTRLYLPHNSDAYRFAVKVWQGHNYAEACRALNADPDEAENWRRQLVYRASREVGRRVTYSYAVRMVMMGVPDDELNRTGGANDKSFRENP